MPSWSSSVRTWQKPSTSVKPVQKCKWAVGLTSAIEIRMQSRSHAARPPCLLEFLSNLSDNAAIGWQPSRQNRSHIRKDQPSTRDALAHVAAAQLPVTAESPSANNCTPCGMVMYSTGMQLKTHTPCQVSNAGSVRC